MKRFVRQLARLTTAVAVAATARGAHAQRDSVTTQAGRRYAAGSLHQLLLGSSYRDLWTAPARIPVLDLGSYAGGLTPTKTGGGLQTVSLRFKSGDGREFAFRSVDKEQTRSLHPDLRHGLFGWVSQDQVSSLVPGAGVVAHPIEDAAGVPHTREQLFVMPDDPRLGEYRKRFAGMVGTLEERPKEGDASLPGLARATRIAETDTMLAAIESGPREQLDAREYLAVRLVDIFLGDWDRHEGQYDWLRYDRPGGGHLWVAMPRDRDYAMVDYDGLLPTLAHSAIHNAIRFRPKIELMGVIVDAAPLDHRLLGGIDHAAWDSVTRAVQARLSDAAIDGAIARLQPEYRAREGAKLARILRGRRDDLARASESYYRTVAREAEAHATNADENAVIERLPSGNVRVTITPAAGGAPEYSRELSWVESREVRVYLHGGADHASVVGSGPEQVIVRVIGGAGDDTLADEGRAGHRTAFYDDQGSNVYERRPHTKVDTTLWRQPPFVPGQGRTPPRDWGASASLATPSAGWRPGGVGPYVGIGPAWTRYGFRREPFAVKQDLRAMWAIEQGRFGVEYHADFRYVGRPMESTLVLARASEMEASRFYGFGNQSADLGFPSSHFRVFERQLLGDASHSVGIARDGWLVLGATGRLTSPEARPGTPAGDFLPRGAKDFLVAGPRVGTVFLRVDSTVYHRSGWTLQAFGSAFPLAAQDASAFGDARAVATTYLSAGAHGPTLALRAGGQRVWGGFPFQYAAYLGSEETIRGYASQRYAGDAAAYGTAELRQVLTRADLLLARGELGAFALTDAGRVWYRGSSPGGWHAAYGGGLFFMFMGRTHAAYVSYAKGEQGSLYAGLGLPF